MFVFGLNGGKGDEAIAKFQIPDMLAGRSQRDALMLIRAVPGQVDMKVVPVRDEKGSIEKMDAPDSPALEFKPDVNQG